MIYLTHDIDWLYPYHPYSILKCITHGKKWITPSQVLKPNLFLQHIIKLHEYNSSDGLDNIWLIGADNRNSYKRFGLRYTTQNVKYRECIEYLVTHQSRIGLHSTTYPDLTTQISQLQNITNQPVLYHRSHFLRQQNQAMLDTLNQSGVKIDFSLGASRSITLPIETPTQPIKQIPTILFDNIFFFKQPEQVFDSFKTTLQLAQQNKRPVAILFHPENFAINGALWEYYTEIIHICRMSGAQLNPSPSDL